MFQRRYGKGLFDILLNNLRDDKPGIIDKVDMIFKDVETEGKKQGYEKASEEYTNAYDGIQEQIKYAQLILNSQAKDADRKTEFYLEQLTQLEKTKEKLEKQLKSKSKQVSSKYNVPIGEVSKSAAAGTLLTGGTVMGGIDLLSLSLDLIYNHKERKLQEAKQEGYLEAKQMFDKKLKKLKTDFMKSDEKGKAQLKELQDMLENIINDIIHLQTQIAELKIML